MRSTDIICDDCEAERRPAMSTTDYARTITLDLCVMYTFANGWAHVPLIGDGIDLCPKCAGKPNLNLSALAQKVRGRS